MICNLILIIFEGIVNILLLPLGVLNFAFDFVTSFTFVQQFIKVIAYLFPWSQLSPLITFIIGMFVFRAIVSLIKTIWDLLPIL